MSGLSGRRTRVRWVATVLALLAIVGVSVVGAGVAQAAPTTPSPTPSQPPLATTVTITTPLAVDYGTTIDLAARVVDAAGDPAEGTVQFTIAGGTTFFDEFDLVDGEAHVVFGAVQDGTVILPYFWRPPSLAVSAIFTPKDAAALEPSEASAVIAIGPAPTTTTVSVTAELPPSTTFPVPVSAVVGHDVLTGGAFMPLEVAGTVDFFVDGVLQATSTVQPSGESQQGLATAMLTLPRPGGAEITAVYSGSDAWATSTSEPVTLSVAALSASSSGSGSASSSTSPSAVKSAPRPTTIPAPPRTNAPSSPEPEATAEPAPASSPVAIASSPVSEGVPVRGLLLTGLVAAILLLAASGALITIRLRRR